MKTQEHAVKKAASEPRRGNDENDELEAHEVLRVLQAVRAGDFSARLPADWTGTAGKVADTFNDIMNAKSRLAAELERVGKAVGKQGKTRQRLHCERRLGAWGRMEASVNSLIDDLLWPTAEITRSVAAVAKGDLSQTVPLEVEGCRLQGEFLHSAKIVNKMIEQMGVFTWEVTRVAREVGAEGKLGGQAHVKGLSGVWRDLTDNVNSMADNLTAQVRNISEVTIAVANGDLSRKITVDVRGEILQLKEAINTMVDQLRSFASEVTRVAREVGTDGKLGGQALVPGVAGTWKDLTDNVNVMAANLTNQVRGIAEVATAIARGDLSRKITVDVQGEILELKNTINTMVDQLNSLAAEVTRVARDVGTEGKLGGQAAVPGVAGTWKDLTDNVNVMAANLTNQVRGIVKVVTAVADGDLTQKLTVESKGEIAALADTINGMTDTLATFADQVTTVAREVGVEGRLGGQANVPGAAGTWKDLTANVNLLAANLTTQVRAIADVATAVTKGDLTRYIQVDAGGELADLKNTINAMIGNLRNTTERNTEQDWLKTNLAKFSRMMQGQRDLYTVAQMLLSELAPLVEAHQGVMYVMTETERGARLKQLVGYADVPGPEGPREYGMGEGLIGQCAHERHRLIVSDVPAPAVRITAGLVDIKPRAVIALPVLFEGQVKAVIELASLNEFTASHIAFLEQLADIVGIVLNNIEATMRTERLLAQSQQLATELQTQQRELQQTNAKLAQKAQLLAAQNAEVERKNQEIEQARRAVEEKAAELALTSRYKSEFLANMSHELRTPLNSILILGQQLAENADGNLAPRQVEFAKTIHAAGTDLLNLISDILDLSKIESGTVTVECEKLPLVTLKETVERNFRHEADARGLYFATRFDPMPHRTLYTDPKRLLQVLKNLVSNALKFTDRGGVTLHVQAADGGWNRPHPVLDRAGTVIAFAVSDTGIGIPPEKQKIIFEAFQQADAGTARKHGGTGLGLAICRELAQLLGGEIRLQSSPGSGSTFTLYLPLTYAGSPARRPAPGPGRGDAEPGPPPLPRLEEVSDDRENLAPGDETLLIVEDDPRYARVLLDLARSHGFRGLVATRGADALRLAHKYRPRAISLDVFLPDVLGWTVLSQLKQDPATRHIPVQIITVDDERPHGLARGAFSHLTKPATAGALGETFERLKTFARTRKRALLVIQGACVRNMGVVELLGHDDVEITVAATGGEGLAWLRAARFDCVVLDLRLSDMSGLDVLTGIRSEQKPSPPVVVFTGPEPSVDEEARLRALSKRVALRAARSPERLLDETSLFLHRVIDALPESKQRMLRTLYESDEALRGRKVLVVDDDVRNIFALSSVLERHGMQVMTASTGRDAIALIERTPDLALTLIDIMMPKMDGYETMRRIRARAELRLLPIIALTAKAMKGDREKCLEAGASDYIVKPVNSQQVLALARTWLHR